MPYVGPLTTMSQYACESVGRKAPSWPSFMHHQTGYEGPIKPDYLLVVKASWAFRLSAVVDFASTSIYKREKDRSHVQMTVI